MSNLSSNFLTEFIANKRLLQRVYLHKLKDQFALSLLPKITGDHQIFAYTKHEKLEKICLDHQEHSSFMKLLQQTMKESRCQLEYQLSSRAALLGEGWLAIADERAPIVYGRAPEPEDTIGFCRAEDGKVIPETYTPMPSYRLITTNGFFSLPKPFHEKLIIALK